MTSVLSVVRLGDLVALLVVLLVVLVDIYGLVSGLRFKALSTVCMVSSVLCILVPVALELVWLVSRESNAPLEWTVAKTVVAVLDIPILLPTVVMKLVGKLLVEMVAILL